MDVNLKQRLLIAIVILALVVIFVPMLFHKHQVMMQTAGLEQEEIPKEPALPNVANLNQQELSTENMTQSTDQTPVPVVSPNETVSETPKPDVAETPKTPVITEQNSVQKIASVPVQKIDVPKNNQPITLKVTPEMLGHVVNDLHVRTVDADSNNVVPETKTVPVQKSPAVLMKPAVTKEAVKSVVSIKSVEKLKQKIVHVASNEKEMLAKARVQKKAFVIQLGSFSSDKNAVNLVHQLRSKGYAAFYRTVKIGQAVNYRVYVGPLTQEDVARKQQQIILVKEKMKGIVIPYKL